jgi:hypothetical protein
MDQLTSRLVFRAVKRHRIKGVILHWLDNKRKYNYVYMDLKLSLKNIYFEFWPHVLSLREHEVW